MLLTSAATIIESDTIYVRLNAALSRWISSLNDAIAWTQAHDDRMTDNGKKKPRVVDRDSRQAELAHFN